MRKIFLILTLVVLLAGLTSAVVNEVNYFRYGTIDSNGNVVQTSTSVNSVKIIGFKCSDSSCSSGVIGNLWSGSVLASIGSQITLNYPTNNPSPNSYGVYMYKDGYIPWERGGITYWGCWDANSYTNYLTKKQSCTSEINSFDVSVDENELNVEVNVQAPIKHAGPLDYVPSQLISYYLTKIDITLEVKDTGSGDIVYSNTKQKTVEFSDDVDVSFSTSLNPGNYNIKVYTTLDNEAKCIDYEIDSKEKSISISEPPECVVDSDCGESFYGDNFCEEGDVHRILTTPVCVDGECSTETTDEFVEWCEFGCSEGECLPEPYTDCGDKKLDSGEECDDGNNVNDDGCSASCKLEDFCPLDEDDYDYVVVIDDGLISDSTLSKAKSEIISLEFEPGEYSVILVARDSYSNRISTFQPNEQYKLSFFKDGVRTALTPATSDLADYVSFAQVNEVVTGNLLLTQGADSIQAIHGKYFEVPTSSPNSLEAVCVGINKNAPEPYCGNSVLEGYEECDDGNTVSGDGCSSNCEIEIIPPYCGDDVCNNGETCSTCETDCGVCPYEPVCGDDIVNQFWEECDDGNLIDGDGCSSNCEIEIIPPYCGDDVCNNGETCSTCETDCGVCPYEPVCGDGVTEGNEECDWGCDNGVVCDNSASSCIYCNSECELITLEENDLVPSISADANTTYGNVPLSVMFTSQGSGGDGVLSYSWDFGDGSVSGSQNVNHIYNHTGTFTATATATDEDGDTVSDSVTIIVKSESSKKKSSSKGGSSCVPDWECYQWEICKNGIKKRFCYDLEDCDSIFNKPLEVMKCDSGPVLDESYQTIGLGSDMKDPVNMDAFSENVRKTSIYLSIGAMILLILLLILLALRR